MAQEIYNNFVKTLKSLFMFEDAAELDFGIYRILKLKHHDIEDYLENRLLAVVEKEVKSNQSDELDILEKKKKEQEEAAKTLNTNPRNFPDYVELCAKIDSYGNRDEMQAEVFTHLNRFFTRYYEDGDFISKRRYKKGDDSYAIPYSGEEVKLYWANEDQYYIKTGEYFRNYKFQLSNGKFCEFTLKDAEQDLNNNIPPKDQVRCFALADEPIEVEGDVLHINFTYLTYKKAKDLQKKLMNAAYEAVKDKIPMDFLPLTASVGENSTLLQKHLAVYVAKNTCDYFIHKDLCGFLTRELDFYIKNEVLFIDDIDVSAPQKFVARLAVAKAIKRVGAHIINMLAQLEDYQKRLWLKKKFVTDTEYCITLDLVPHELYAEIAANDRQREEWVKLFAIDEIKDEELGLHTSYSEPLTAQFLEENQHLVLDTQFFPADFKRRLLSPIENIDEQCNGLLINSENFQALQLLQEKYQEKVQCIYIDPPYNTGGDDFKYKDGYQHSTWLTLMHDRLEKAKQTMQDDSVIFISIDDNEQVKCKELCDEVFGNENFCACLIWKNKFGSGAMTNTFIGVHEYVLVYSKLPLTNITRTLTEEERAGYNKLRDEKYATRGGYITQPLAVTTFGDRPNLRYPIYYEGQEIWPNKQWVWEKSRMMRAIENNEVVFNKQRNGSYNLRSKKYLIDEDGNERRGKPTTFITNVYTQNGTEDIRSLFSTLVFDYSKPVDLIKQFVSLDINDSFCKNYTVVDFFSGSGTTGHAVINLNNVSSTNFR